MKHASMSGLLYKELYSSKKQVLITIGIAILLSALMLLLLLSFQFGNLSLLDEDNRYTLWNIAIVYGKYLPLFVFCSISTSVLESSVKMEDTKWRRYILSGPISGFRYAASQFLFSALLILVSLGLAAAYLGIFNAIYPEQITVGTWGILFLLMALYSLMQVLIKAFTLHFNSLEKGGMAATAVLFVSLALFYGPFNSNMSELQAGSDIMSKIETIGKKALPYAIIILICSYLAGFIACGFLYERREK